MHVLNDLLTPVAEPEVSNVSKARGLIFGPTHPPT
jgi:hypothetical protein